MPACRFFTFFAMLCVLSCFLCFWFCVFDPYRSCVLPSPCLRVRACSPHVCPCSCDALSFSLWCSVAPVDTPRSYRRLCVAKYASCGKARDHGFRREQATKRRRGASEGTSVFFFAFVAAPLSLCMCMPSLLAPTRPATLALSFCSGAGRRKRRRRKQNDLILAFAALCALLTSCRFC